MGCCSAVNCSNRSEKGNRLYRFPKDDRRAKWVKNMRRGNNWSPTDSSRLCQQHFEDSQFERNRLDGWRKLKPNAIPTIFCFNVPNPQPIIDPPPRISLYESSINDVNIESQIVEPPNLPIVQDVLHVPHIESSINDVNIESQIVEPPNVPIVQYILHVPHIESSINDVNIESQIVEPPNVPIVQYILHVPHIESSINDVNIESQIVEPPNVPIVQYVLHVPHIENSINDVNIESQIVEPPNVPIVQDVLHVSQIEYKSTKAMARKRRRTQQNTYDGTCKTTKYVVNNTEPQNDRPGTSEKTVDGIRNEPQNNQPVKSAGSESATKKPGVAVLDTVKCEQRCVHYPDIPPTFFLNDQEPLSPVLTPYDQELLPPVLTSYDQERLPTRTLILRDD